MARSKLSATDVRTLQTLLLASVFEQGSIGRRIAEARRDAGLTQDQLSDLVGVSMRTIQNWEGGDTSAYRHMRQIAEITGRSLQWLLHGESGEDESLAKRVEAMQSQLDRIEQLLRPPGDPGSGRRSAAEKPKYSRRPPRAS